MSEDYVELHCHSFYSLLDGASSPEALVEQAAALGMQSLAITDHDSLAGAIRFWKAAQRHNIHPLFGAEITLVDGSHLTLLAENGGGYANLCRLVTQARLGQLPSGNEDQPSPSAKVTASGKVTATEKSGSHRAQVAQEDNQPDQPWAGKISPRLNWTQLAEHAKGLIALSGCQHGPLAAPLLQGDRVAAAGVLAQLQHCFGSEQLYIEVQQHGLPNDQARNAALIALATQHKLPLVVTNNVHYATPAGARLRDVLIATANNCTLQAAHHSGLLPNSSRYSLLAPQQMAQPWAAFPQALRATVEIAQRCQISLDFSQQRLPTFPIPAYQPNEFAYLYQLCHEQLPHRYPSLFPKVLQQLAGELAVIERAHLAGYFLLVWDIVREARARGIRCQGRGSAANSIVAYLLGITSIDPLAHNLLFERFLSEDRFTMPDIDIDFAADRREEIIQYVYQRYGRDHAAMACNIVTYRARSAIRDIGKALDFPQERIDQLCNSLDTFNPAEAAEHFAAQLPADAPLNHPLRLLSELLRAIDGCPRHLSIHSGGMVITGPPLAEVVPLEPATMAGRVVCQWDKDSLEDAGLVKIDLLSLRTLGLISEACALITEMGEPPPDFDHMALDDPAVFAMLGEADTIGTFQVESRAQQQMLPRLRPASFEDMAVEVAIVRPGPIQGGAVHPYLRRRRGEEAVTYAHPCLEEVLSESLGVLLFQEQAIRVAVAAAGFTPGEADLLRRALSRSRPGDALDKLRLRFIEGAAKQTADKEAIEAEAANAIFDQLAGFAGFGFCKSHAASFALIAYHTLHLKIYHAPAFYVALLNQQPMGFYSPEVITGDAQRHGVDLLPPDIVRSQWRSTLERAPTGAWAIRTALSAVKELGEAGWERLAQARASASFSDLADIVRRAALSKPVIQALIRAGALDSMGERRQLLWQLGDVDDLPNGLTLPPTTTPITAIALPELSSWERTLWEYELLGLSPAGHLMLHYRPGLRGAGISSTWQVKQMRSGQLVKVAGMITVRQRPETAKGIMFISLEDEGGLLDLIVYPDIYIRLRPTLRHELLIVASGVVQRDGAAVNVLVQTAEPLGAPGELQS